MKNSSENIISETRKWIDLVVIGCNFCPFAARVVKQNSIHYEVSFAATLNESLPYIDEAFNRLNDNSNIETSFLIFPESFAAFADFLDLVNLAENLLSKSGYDGIYQIASFHPEYRFADAISNDAANYTNRSVYPMLHFLREDSISKALNHYTDPESIPLNNVAFAREKGTVYMKMLRDSCLSS